MRKDKNIKPEHRRLPVMDKIVGIVFPIPEQFVNRLMIEGRDVFVKYLPRITGLKIAPKDRLLFYVSHSSKEIVGEGRIEEISFLTPDAALEKYGIRLFLNQNELREYTLRRPERGPSKKMLVLVLSRLKRYTKPKKPKRSITMAGQYVTQEEYLELLG